MIHKFTCQLVIDKISNQSGQVLHDQRICQKKNLHAFLTLDSTTKTYR